MGNQNEPVSNPENENSTFEETNNLDDQTELGNDSDMPTMEMNSKQPEETDLKTKLNFSSFKV